MKRAVPVAICIISVVLFVLYPVLCAPATLKYRIGIFFVGALSAALAAAAACDLSLRPRPKTNVCAFSIAVFVQMLVGWLILTFPSVGALYWDTHHTLELTNIGVFSDWRSFLFELTSAYILLIVNHVYAVPIVGAFLCAVALSLPVLWARRPWLVSVASLVIGISPYYLIQSTKFFTDSFFAAFTVLSCYALIAFIKCKERRGLWTIGVMFVVCAVFATFVRHNGSISAVIFAVALLVVPRRRARGAALVACMFALLGAHSVLKGSALYPEAHAEAPSTNRNFQTVALLLNPWGAMLSHNYKTPSKEFDRQILSQIIDPTYAAAHYNPKSSMPLWEKFADPWRTLDNKTTRDFVKVSAIRILHNLPIVFVDRYELFSGAILHPDYTPGFEKICALGKAITCPSAGVKSELYREQVRSFVRAWPQWADSAVRAYAATPGTTFVFIACAIWLFVAWLVRREVFLFCAVGVISGAALFATMPTPESRYLFVLVALAFAAAVSFLASIGGRPSVDAGSTA